MPKFWLFIVLCLTAASFIGCGANAETAAPVPSPSAQQESTEPTEAAPVPTFTTPPTVQPLSSMEPAVKPEEPEASQVEQVINGQVLDALARNPTEIELLMVQDADGKVWGFLTDGPIGIDAAHLLIHRDLGAEVEVVFVERDGRLIALRVSDFVSQ